MSAFHLFSLFENNIIDNPEMLKEKIFSIVDHMTDNHIFEENSEHKKFEHPPLPDDGSRTRPWLKTGSKVLLVKLC